MPDTPATAEGDLDRTPFAHLLVYAADRRLSGVLFLTEPGGVEHVVRFARGAPVKVRPGDRYALLGELLVEAGVLDPATLAEALKTHGLLGDVLLLAGCVERDALERVAEQQFVRRMVRLFSLPKETRYRYCEGHFELCDWGGEPASVDPLSLIWAGIREHAEASTMLDGTLALLSHAPIRLSASHTVPRLGLEREEAELFAHLAASPCSLDALIARGTAPEPVVRRLAYALVITRQIDVGAGGSPVGANDGRRNKHRPVAKMQLRSTVHRVGAAAPDPPGDGERGSSNPPMSRDPTSRSAEPPSSRDRVVEPPSSKDRGVDPSSSKRGAEPAPVSDVTARDPSQGRIAMPPDAPKPSSRRAPSDSGIVPRTAEDRTKLAPSVPIGLSAGELYDLAAARLAARDLQGALEACGAGRLAAPDDADLVALSVWVRASMGGADIKALSVELDEVLRAAEAHVQARYYRAMLRKRLSDGAGMLRDLTRVVELAPDHPEATRELAIAEGGRAAGPRAGLLNRIFKR